MSFFLILNFSNKHRKSHDIEEVDKTDISIEKSSIMQGICEVKKYLINQIIFEFFIFCFCINSLSYKSI